MRLNLGETRWKNGKKGVGRQNNQEVKGALDLKMASLDRS